jgi:hypothetical protein
MSSPHDFTSDEEDLKPGILITARDRALTPFHYAVSKPARRTYLSLSLFFLTSLILLCTAVIAYIAFYNSYIPNKGFTRPVYLQFDSVLSGSEHGPSRPWATVDLGGELISGQPYDISVVLHMPRSQRNKEAGNFMVDVKLLAPLLPHVERPEETLVHSRRPAILTYYSNAMEHVHNAAGLPLHLLGVRKEEEVLVVPMMESVSFEKGWRNVPTRARVEIQSEGTLQVYDARLEVKAQLQGLRWIMYNYRLVSFVVLTFVFWCTEMGVAGGIYAGMLYLRRETEAAEQVVKREENGRVKSERGTPGSSDVQRFSDTERFYPSPGGSRGHPLRYTPTVKEPEPEVKLEPQESVPPAGVEADDEDEDADFVIEDVGRRTYDSGLGTSMESSATTGRGQGVRRRRSGPLKPEPD